MNKQTLNILALSDTHCKHSQLNNWFKFNQDIVDKTDVIIYAGDSSDSRNERTNLKEQVDFINWYANIKKSDNSKLVKLYIAGNHNTSEHIIDDIIYIEKGIERLYNKSTSVYGFNIFGSPYSQEFGYGWAYNYSRKDNTFWNMIPDDTDIVVTHGMPYNTLDLVHNDNPYQNGNIQTKPVFNIVGDRYLSERINQIKPKLYIGGHIHDNPGYYSIKNNSIVIKDDIMYANVSIVDNNMEVVNIPKFITITK